MKKEMEAVENKAVVMNNKVVVTMKKMLNK